MPGLYTADLYWLLGLVPRGNDACVPCLGGVLGAGGFGCLSLGSLGRCRRSAMAVS